MLGDDACVDGGNVTFDAFIDRLIRTGDHPLWRFTPGRATIPASQSVPESNVGGEFHTFSRTAECGGGFVEELNELLGLEEIADGCTQPPGPTNLFLGAGESGSGSTAALGSGTHDRRLPLFDAHDVPLLAVSRRDVAELGARSAPSL